MRRFLARIGEGGGPPPLIDPRSLPFLELDLDAHNVTVGDGASISTGASAWPDASGHARNGGQSTAAARPVFHSTGPALSPNGGPAVTFDGLAVNGDRLDGVFPLAAVPDTRGHTFYGVARIRANLSPFNASDLWQTDAGSVINLNPETENAINKYGWREYSDGIHDTATTFVAGPQLLTFRFAPPQGAGQGGITSVFKGGLLLGSFTNWVWSAASATGYYLGANEVFNIACGMDCWRFLWFSASHADGTRKGVEAFLKHQWGL
jgi:hypothetical protein